jgi:putative ABC transport system permease protein
VLAEAAALVACGLTAGAVLGWALSRMLARVLTGVFDPPPTAVSAPWIYLAATVIAAIVAIGVVSAATVRLARRSPLTVLGEL